MNRINVLEQLSFQTHHPNHSSSYPLLCTFPKEKEHLIVFWRGFPLQPSSHRRLLLSHHATGSWMHDRAAKTVAFFPTTKWSTMVSICFDGFRRKLALLLQQNLLLEIYDWYWLVITCFTSIFFKIFIEWVPPTRGETWVFHPTNLWRWDRWVSKTPPLTSIRWPTALGTERNF